MKLLVNIDLTAELRNMPNVTLVELQEGIRVELARRQALTTEDLKLLAKTDKISVIRMLRLKSPGLGLHAAKAIVDDWEKEAL